MEAPMGWYHYNLAIVNHMFLWTLQSFLCSDVVFSLFFLFSCFKNGHQQSIMTTDIFFLSFVLLGMSFQTWLTWLTNFSSSKIFPPAVNVTCEWVPSRLPAPGKGSGPLPPPATPCSPCSVVPSLRVPTPHPWAHPPPASHGHPGHGNLCH